MRLTAEAVMHRLGRITTWLGIILASVGVIAGFSLLAANQQAVAKFFLMLTPIGFILLLTGLVTTLMVDKPENPLNPD